MSRRTWALSIAVATAVLVSSSAALAARNDVAVLGRVPAHYPAIARGAEISGRVDVIVTVASSGSVESVRLAGADHPIFRRAAILAAWLSKYAPATVDGVAVRDSIALEFVFAHGRDTSTAIYHKSHDSSEYTVDLASNQVCLYGNWLSGPVTVRKREDRVYIGGIRVFPEISSLDTQLNPGLGVPGVLEGVIAFECRLYERELVLGGVAVPEARRRSAAMLEDYDTIESVHPVDAGLHVELRDGTSLEVELPDPTDSELYFSLQPLMASPDDEYWGWLGQIHPRVGNAFVVFAEQTSASMSLMNTTAVSLRGFLAEGGNLKENAEWPPELEALAPLLPALIRRPLRVPRL